MTTFTTFTPSNISPFQFSPTLDGITYNAICTWNVYSERYYINIYTQTRTLIMSRPIIGSPNNYDINLLFGYFKTSTLVYRTSSNQFEVTP
jgi:hypothetical protein